MDEKELNQVEDNSTDYIAEIENLKANSVSKDDYLKLKNENAKLIKTLATNQKLEQEEKQPEVSKEQKIARHKELVDLVTNTDGRKGVDIIKDVIEFRDLTKELYGVDPMIVNIHDGSKTDSDKMQESVDRTMDGFKEILETCDGTEEDFLLHCNRAGLGKPFK